jgi:hypothetical protein
MVDGGNVDPLQRPAVLAQARAELALLAAVHVTVGEIAHRLDRAAAVEPAAVEPRDGAGKAVGLVAAGALRELAVAARGFDDHAADARERRVLLEPTDRRRQEAGTQRHVAVHQADIAAA